MTIHLQLRVQELGASNAKKKKAAQKERLPDLGRGHGINPYPSLSFSFKINKSLNDSPNLIQIHEAIREYNNNTLNMPKVLKNRVLANALFSIVFILAANRKPAHINTLTYC